MLKRFTIIGSLIWATRACVQVPGLSPSSSGAFCELESTRKKRSMEEQNVRDIPLKLNCLEASFRSLKS